MVFIPAQQREKKMKLSEIQAIRAATRTGFKPPLSQAAFAKVIGIPVSTLKAWEYRIRKPSGAAETLLKLFQAHPEIVKVLIEKQTQHKTQK